MKNLLFIFLLFGLKAASQTAFPLYVPNASDTIKLIGSINGAPRTIRHIDLTKNKLNITDTSIIHAQIANNTSVITANTSAIAGKVDSVKVVGTALNSYKQGAPTYVATVANYNFTTLKNGDYLKYDSINNQWVNTVAPAVTAQIFDSIKAFTGTALPSGNIGISLSDNRIHYRPGNNYEYRIGVLDSSVVNAGLMLQNFDAVTAPAIPSGWVTTAGVVTASGTSVSAPNSLQMPISNAAVQTAMYNTVDTKSGNVTVTANLRLVSGHEEVLILGRASTTSWGTMTAYGARLWINNTTSSANNGIGLNKGASLGTNLTATPIGQGTTFTTGEWYEMSMTINGTTTTTITIKVKRVSDGAYLNSSGTFVSGVQTALTYVDSSSPVQGAGYSGIASYIDNLSGNVSGNNLIDNFSVQ